MVEKIKKHIKTFVIIAGVICFMLLLRQCNKTKELKKQLKQQEQIANQNYAALNDSIKVYKNILGQTSFSKPIAQMNSEDIKKYFPDLYEKLKAELGEVKVIWKTQFIYKDTGSVTNAIIKLDSNKYALKYDYFSSDSTLRIKSTNTFFATPILVNGELNQYSIITEPGISTIDEMSLSLSFTTGIKKDGDKHVIFITPNSNKVTISHIEGADVSDMISPPVSSSKPKKWSVGPYIGFGVSFGKNSQYELCPSAGIGIQYSIINF
ncbi:MAG: hypothetical protein WC466_09005 [Candidatus Izemoplasmatales bacterium]